ncbi:hypothetical protein PL9214500060 [Planktothrix tepida PCC 9214]|uniref:Uncharacterized protein n=1 Tax=Planktothrix tepida PCC 9214 TaxID=671072 RepID=A0A1J1LJN3_9CYAN|nr:hypothetical protein PL9214500060 [Planktothrix tepida PCC 9214]
MNFKGTRESDFEQIFVTKVNNKKDEFVQGNGSFSRHLC